MSNQIKVGRLIGFGLQPKLNAARDEEYRELLALYRDDVDFRRAVNDTAEGQGLVVLGGDDQALILGARASSPFAARLEEYGGALRSGARQSEERLVHGLIQLALAAYVFPDAQALEQDGRVVRVSALQLDSYLRDLCGLLGQERRDEDPPADYPEFEQAYRVYSRRHAARETSDGRGHASSTVQMTKRALEWLEAQSLVRKASDDDEGTYQVLGRYRTLVRDLAGHQLFDEIVSRQQAATLAEQVRR